MKQWLEANEILIRTTYRIATLVLISTCLFLARESSNNSDYAYYEAREASQAAEKAGKLSAEASEACDRIRRY